MCEDRKDTKYTRGPVTVNIQNDYSVFSLPYGLPYVGALENGWVAEPYSPLKAPSSMKFLNLLRKEYCF